MKIKNNSAYILKNYEVADTSFKKAIGIMFRKRIEKPMLFTFFTRGRISIHSFFCPLFDAVFLDDRKRVVDIYRQIRSGQIIVSKEIASYLVEFPPGTVSKENIRKGVVIKFKH